MMRLFLERLNALLQWQSGNKLNATGRRHTLLKHSGLTILRNATQKSGANGWLSRSFGETLSQQPSSPFMASLFRPASSRGHPLPMF